MKKINCPDFAELSNTLADTHVNKRADAARDARASLWSSMSDLLDSADAEGRELTASERREYDKAEQVLDKIDVAIKAAEVEKAHYVEQMRGVIPGSGSSGRNEYREGMPLAAGQTFAGYARARGHIDRDASGQETPLDFGKYMRGAFTGDWRNADAERHQYRNALSGGSAGAGGVLIPTSLSSSIIDLARNDTRVLEAGATLVPMDSRTVDVPKWTADPAFAWRAENGAIAESDATLDKITLAAKSLAVVTKVSRELIEDTDIADELRKAFAASFARALDYGALYGSGSSNQPTGVKANANVTKTSMGTNGATPSWDTLVDAVGRLRDQNEEPTAQILADRTQRTLAKIKDSTGAYISPPTYLDDVKRLETNQVPINLTQGTSSDASDIFTADWRQLFVGVRIDLTISVLEERYMPDAGQFGFVAWWRGDIQVARPKAFDVVVGARP